MITDNEYFYSLSYYLFIYLIISIFITTLSFYLTIFFYPLNLSAIFPQLTTFQKAAR